MALYSVAMVKLCSFQKSAHHIKARTFTFDCNSPNRHQIKQKKCSENTKRAWHTDWPIQPECEMAINWIPFIISFNSLLHTHTHMHTDRKAVLLDIGKRVQKVFFGKEAKLREMLLFCQRINFFERYEREKKTQICFIASNPKATKSFPFVWFFFIKNIFPFVKMLYRWASRVLTVTAYLCNMHKL